MDRSVFAGVTLVPARRGAVPTTEHDLHIDVIVTPSDALPDAPDWRVPQIQWEELTDEKIAAIPLLGRIKG
jgi:5-formyltetrahydrofolate cyclo-ligase